LSCSALHSPSAGSQVTLKTLLNSSSSLTTIGWWSSSSTICRERSSMSSAGLDEEVDQGRGPERTFSKSALKRRCSNSE